MQESPDNTVDDPWQNAQAQMEDAEALAVVSLEEPVELSEAIQEVLEMVRGSGVSIL